MKLLLSTLTLLWCISLLGQNADSTTTTIKTTKSVSPAVIHYQGNKPRQANKIQATKKVELWDSLKLEVDDRIELLSKSYFESKKIKGYRIQLFSGNSRFEATKVKSNFINKYKNTASPELMYQTPNFKLRVGNYRNRLQAQKDLLKYKEEFPSAFLVKDEIEISFEDQ